MTKAELQEALDLSEAHVVALEDKLSRTVEAQTGLLMWVANNSHDAPLCIGSCSKGWDSSFGVTIYHNQGSMMGIMIFDKNGEIIHVSGYVPAAVLDEEIRLAKGERIAV